jgi:hypothetical protein
MREVSDLVDENLEGTPSAKPWVYLQLVLADEGLTPGTLTA